MVVNHELLEMGIVQFSNNEERESKMLPSHLWPKQTFQNQTTVDACELFADDEPKSKPKKLSQRARKSS